MPRLILCTLFAVLAAMSAVFIPSTAMAGPFGAWAALVVAGDSRAHNGQPSEVFDNGRRDISKALQSIGFQQSHILQYSVQPKTDTETNPKRTDPDDIRKDFMRLAMQSQGGCFIYYTSHGGLSGIELNGAGFSPRDMAKLVDDACADRMTVVVVSACYSGIFVPMLRSDTRLVMTAARDDRTSFGCGEANKYTYFDQCVVESFPESRDFPRLAYKVQDCVAAREKAEGVKLASEPQISMGNVIARLLPQYAFPAQ